MYGVFNTICITLLGFNVTWLEILLHRSKAF